MKTKEELLLTENNELIQLALDLLKVKYPAIRINPDEYHTKVWKGSNGIAVDFIRIVQYLPMDKADIKLVYDVVVNLANQEIIPFDNPDLHGEFYIPSTIDIEALTFIKKHLGVFSSHFENVIHEDEDEYHIHCSNDESYKHYTLNKKSGEQGLSARGLHQQIPKPSFENRRNPFYKSSSDNI